MWRLWVSLAGATVFLVLGYRWPRVRRPFFRTGLAADVLHAVVNGPVLDGPIAWLLTVVTRALEASVSESHLYLMAAQPWWQQLLAFLIAGDLVKWSIHYAHHHVPMLWELHRLHHSTSELDALSAVRSHPLEVMLNKVPFLVTVVVVLGIDLRIILGYTLADTIQGLWVHSNTHLRTRWLNYVLATQEFHHWHHSTAPAARNKNFGGFLSIWDWVFGTAYCPRSDDVARFGLDETEPPARYSDHVLLRF